jgi:hypothetical protein
MREHYERPSSRSTPGFCKRSFHLREVATVEGIVFCTSISSSGIRLSAISARTCCHPGEDLIRLPRTGARRYLHALGKQFERFQAVNAAFTQSGELFDISEPEELNGEICHEALQMRRCCASLEYRLRVKIVPKKEAGNYWDVFFR